MRYFALGLTYDPWQLLGRTASPWKTPWNHRKKETLQTAPYTMTGGEKERAIYGLDLDFHEKGPVPVPPAHKASPWFNKIQFHHLWEHRDLPMTPRVHMERGSSIQVTERADSEGWWGSSQEEEERRSGRRFTMQNVASNTNLTCYPRWTLHDVGQESHLREFEWSSVKQGPVMR